MQNLRPGTAWRPVAAVGDRRPWPSVAIRGHPWPLEVVASCIASLERLKLLAGRRGTGMINNDK